MQYHVVVDHIVFYVIHSQEWYNIKQRDSANLELTIRTTMVAHGEQAEQS